MSLVSLGIRGYIEKTLYQLSQGFVGAEGSRVKVLPKDVEGDAPFGLQLINLTQLSSSPSPLLMLSEEGERQGLVLRLYLLAYMFFYLISVCVTERKREREQGKSG